MTRIIGDRRENTLDEMEEVARERNRDVAEEERMEKLEAERRAREEAERKEKGISEAPAGIQHSASNIILANYHGLEWELRAPREGAQGAKKRYTYDESLNSLEKIGKRHPTPSEALTLLADHLEGKISGDLKATAEDMLYNYGEWLSMAVERQEDMLICYLHPKGLVWDANESRYKKNKFQYESREEFNVALMPSATWIPLDKFSDNFVKLFYGRSFKELPEKMRKGVKKAHISLPANDYVCTCLPR